LKTVLLASSFVVAAVAQQQCVPYASSFTFPATQYPTIWKQANTTQFNTAEYQALYKSIDWTKVPNIAPTKMDATGAFITTGYPATDPNCWWTWNGCVTPKAPGVNPDIYTCPEPDTWGLTYDDGPNCTHNVLYDYLKANNQKATMFYIGSNVADWPNEAQRGLTDGHQICVHTWSHPYMTTLTNQEVLGELYYTRKVIKYVIGVTPLCWRPPFGDVDDRVRAIAQQLNLTTVIWDQDTDDWQMIPAGTEPQSYVDGMYQNFINKGDNGTYSTHGTIVLSHELNNGTMSESIKWLPQVKQAYKYVVPVATCMNITQPYVESNVTYPNFNQYVGLPNQPTSAATGASLVTQTPTSAASSVRTTLCAGIVTLIVVALCML